MTLDVLTWPIHGAYMSARSRVPVRWSVPVAPRASPTGTVHPITEPGTTVVHVTPYNALMRDTGRHRWSSTTASTSRPHPRH